MHPDRFSQVIRCLGRSGLFVLDERAAREIVDGQTAVISDRFDELSDEAELGDIDRERLRRYALYDCT